MARVTETRKREMRKFIERWEPFTEEKGPRTIKVDPMVLRVAIKMLKEFLD